MTKSLRVGIIAPCSTVPALEFSVGEQHLRSHGFDVRTHPQVLEHHFTFAGTDASRAAAFFDYASDPSLDILWSARGGYGASRLVRYLDQLTAQRGKPPHKLLIGYSDITVLHEYTRQVWGWSTLHSPMPAAADFTRLRESEWQNILSLARGQFVDYPATDAPLQPLANPSTKPIRAELIGGNLSLWAALVGTSHGPTPAKGRILFLEDVDEAFYRLDRMITQVREGGLLDGAAAIVLGDMTHCKDDVSTCLAPCTGDALQTALDDPSKAPRIPLRKIHSYEEGIDHVFTSLAREMNIPLYQGLRVGHGPNFHPLPLGATYELSPDHRLKLLNWDWTK
ncbi:MAG TPA: LD-carboxypeptidase [Tepidisphaeraceae bacterium]|jgi:muramoyltetrapeptide carboxypeptidase|nr:LD-carboxypeptidase [Tepidisphaeraceae bacterium]